MITYYMDTKHHFGYGDAIAGIMSAYLISKHFNTDLVVVWTIDLTHLFRKVQQGNLREYSPLVNPESEDLARQVLSKLRDSSREDVTLCTNAPWHTFLYTNARDLCKDTRNTYRLIYSTIMPPRSHVRKQAKELLSTFPGRYIGVAVRCGDYSWTPTCSNVYIKSDSFGQVANKIAASLPRVDGLCQNVFVTSDNNALLNMLCKRLKRAGYNVVTTGTPKVHIINAARDNNSQGIDDTVLEHVVLSRCDSFLVTKDVSNFGLTAAMISGSNSVWSFDTQTHDVRKLSRRKVVDMSKGGVW